MADALKQDIITTSFINGEQPDGYKLTSPFTQMENAIDIINQAIGDLYTQQTHSKTGGAGTYSLSQLALVGPNISRLIGSAGHLNPRHPGRIRVTDHEVIFAGHRSAALGGDPPSIDSVYGTFDHYNRKEFRLPFIPIIFSSAEGAEVVTFSQSWSIGGCWSIGSPGAGYSDGSAKATNRVASIGLLNSSGDYHVSGDGIITLYDGLSNGEGIKVTYTFDTIPDSYDGASLNVMPDFSQSTTLCTVALVSGSTYDVTLPAALARRCYSDLTNWLPPVLWYPWDNVAAHADPLDGEQLTLPTVLSDNLSVGDVIPSGFIQLWDDTSGQIIGGLTFTYRSMTTVRVSGTSLTAGSNRYRLVVPGTSIARTVDKLRENAYWHDHSGRFLYQDGLYMGHRISHMDLLNNIDEGSTTHADGFQPAAIGPARHPHPQLLHRRGYKYDNEQSDEGNWHNAMVGPLMMAGNDGTDDGSADSEYIYWGGPTSCAAKYDQSEASLLLRFSRLKAEEGVVSGNNAASTNGLKWIRFFGSTDASSPSAITGIPKPSDYHTIYGSTITTQESSDVWYTSNPFLAETNTKQLGIVSVDASGATITVNVNHGTDFDSQIVYGIIFYI